MNGEYNHNEHTGEIDEGFGGDIAALQAQITALNTTVTNLQTNITGFAASIGANAAAIALIQTDITTIQGQITAINGLLATALQQNGVNGTFAAGAQTITVVDGQITSIV